MITGGLRVWRRRKLARAYPDRGKVSAHFRHQEFWCRDGTPIPASDANLRGIERHCELLLEPMRARFGACHVLSGYRHRSYNRSIGGAADSFHIWDEHRNCPATDLVFSTGIPEAWGAYARTLMINGNEGLGGVGIYRQLGFVHVDLRPYVANWRGSGE